VIVFLTIPQQQVMAPEILQPGAIEAESSRLTDAPYYVPAGETQQQSRHLSVHRDSAFVATEIMSQEAHWKIVR